MVAVTSFDYLSDLLTFSRILAIQVYAYKCIELWHFAANDFAL